MDCIGMVWKPDHQIIHKPIGILENKIVLSHVHGSGFIDLMLSLGIDNRLLTVFYLSAVPEYSGFIVVYDFETFYSDKDMMEAIIWHEIGHLANPTDVITINQEAEQACDRLAYEKAGYQAIRNVLLETLKMGNMLQNPIIIGSLENRIAYMDDIHRQQGFPLKET